MFAWGISETATLQIWVTRPIHCSPLLKFVLVGAEPPTGLRAWKLWSIVSVDFFSPHNRYRLAFGPGLYFLLGINHTDVSDTQKCETVSRFYMKTFPGIRQGYSPGDYDHIAKPLIKKQSKDIRPSRWAMGDNGREVYRYTYSPDNIKYLTSEYKRHPSIPLQQDA